MLRWVSIALLVGFGIIYTAYSLDQNQTGKIVSFGKYDISVEIADSDDERTKGLSGTSPLGESQGMLFVFTSDDRHSFWMKGMNYPIDIVWLNSKKQIVDIKANADPSSYPASFAPRSAARYVVELKGGAAASNGLTIGQQATF